jgi:spore coat polysaccharide biosynthesis protein SpsF (cytidylyltransferase family)
MSEENNRYLTLIALTARMGSERCPGKVLTKIGNRPLIEWIAERLLRAGRVVLATSQNPKDDPLADWAKGAGIPCYRGAEQDVLDRILTAYAEFNEGETYLMRGLGDCPFPNPRFILRAVRVMEMMAAEVFYWCLPPLTWPVYGSREFPLHISAWQKLADWAESPAEHEHPDLGLHRRRQRFKAVYHEPPPPIFFRPQYRLEVDYPADIEFLQSVFNEFGYWPEVEELIDLLDSDRNLARINQDCEEKTGPTISFDKTTRLEWLDDLEGKQIIFWDDEVWQPLNANSKPIFCKEGTCLIGQYGRGVLRLRGGVEVRSGAIDIPCPCGAGRHWRPNRVQEGKR